MGWQGEGGLRVRHRRVEAEAGGVRHAGAVGDVLPPQKPFLRSEPPPIVICLQNLTEKLTSIHPGSHGEGGTR